MENYTCNDYQAWVGLMVSHPVFGGGVIVRAVSNNGKIWIPVRFQSGYRKAFTADEARTSLKSLWGRLSAPLKPVSDESSDKRLQDRIREAQRRHDAGYQIEDDLEERLRLAAGLPLRAARPQPARCPPAWIF